MPAHSLLKLLQEVATVSYRHDPLLTLEVILGSSLESVTSLQWKLQWQLHDKAGLWGKEGKKNRNLITRSREESPLLKTYPAKTGSAVS